MPRSGSFGARWTAEDPDRANISELMTFKSWLNGRALSLDSLRANVSSEQGSMSEAQWSGASRTQWDKACAELESDCRELRQASQRASQGVAAYILELQSIADQMAPIRRALMNLDRTQEGSDNELRRLEEQRRQIAEWRLRVDQNVVNALAEATQGVSVNSKTPFLAVDPASTVREVWATTHTPAELAVLLESDPRTAAAASQRKPTRESLGGFLSDKDAQRLTELLTEEPSTQRMTEVSQLMNALSAEQRERLVLAFPMLGNVDGVPFEDRFKANRVNIQGAIYTRELAQSKLDKDEREAKEALEEYRRQERTYSIWVPKGQPESMEERLSAKLAFAEAAARENREASSSYKELLTAGDVDSTSVTRQILVFDDVDQGRYAEVWGDMSKAKNVGIVVPGTGTRMHNNAISSGRWWRTAANSGGGSALIYWAAADFPETIPFIPVDSPTATGSAMDRSFAENMALPLKLSVDAVRQEGGNRSLNVTLCGYSYGGVGAGGARALGADVDNLVFIASPGISPRPIEVSSRKFNGDPRIPMEYAKIPTVADYPDSGRTKYYQMTSDGDMIKYPAKMRWFGGDPREDPRVIDLGGRVGPRRKRASYLDRGARESVDE